MPASSSQLRLPDHSVFIDTVRRYPSSASNMSASRASLTCAGHLSCKPNCAAWAICSRAAPGCQGYFPIVLEFIHRPASRTISFGFSRLRGRMRNYISFYFLAFLDSRLFYRAFHSDGVIPAHQERPIPSNCMIDLHTGRELFITPAVY